MLAHKLESFRARTFFSFFITIGLSVKKGKRGACRHRKLRRYYLIILLLSNISTLACLPLSSI